MSNKMHWGLLTREEQDAAIAAHHRAIRESGAIVEDVVNALPARLFGPRLPEGWRIDRCDDGAIIVRGPDGGVVLGVWDNGIAATIFYKLAKALLKQQEGE